MTNKELNILRAVTDRLQSYITDSGGCDHPVGICCCDDIRVMESAYELMRMPTNG